jgi:hypothetical protein
VGLEPTTSSLHLVVLPFMRTCGWGGFPAGQHPGVDAVGLAGERRQPLHLLRVRDLDLPASLGGQPGSPTKLMLTLSLTP